MPAPFGPISAQIDASPQRRSIASSTVRSPGRNETPLNSFRPHQDGPTTQTPKDYAYTLYLPPEFIAFAYIYANRELVWSGPVRDWEVIRLPSGFKTSVWQMQVVAQAPIYSIHVATTAKELSRV